MRAFGLIVCLVLAGCASSSGNIRAVYVSPLQYRDFTCAQLADEAKRISARVAEVTGQQDRNATMDFVATAAAVVILFPIFMLNGDGQTAAELGRLKGEFEAVEKASIRKNCNLRFHRG